MSPIQKQAVLVCAVCALAILITASVTYVLLATKGGAPSSSSVPQVEEPDDLATHYQVDTQSAALLTETADAGEAYLNDTLFLGDSNTVRLYNNGLITLQQFCAKEGIGIQTALSEPLVTFRGTDERYTMAQAVAMMKPRRVVITLGTNDSGMEVETFIGYYTQLVQQIQASYPYTDIIVNTVPPVPEDHSNYPSTSQEKLDDFNMALLTMCENLGVKFLNSAEVLKDPATGFGLNDYYISGDIHLKNSGLKAMLSYLTTHAYETEERRPDTDNIPTRTLEYTSNPSDPVAPSSSSQAAGETFEARYRIDQTGGTLTSGGAAGETALRFDVTGEQSVTVTAVPDEGYFFVNWSDGVTSRTRTDSSFKQNLDVTAVFSRASVEIVGEGSGLLGMNYTFTARLSGQYAKAENLHWYVNGEESTEAAGRTSVSFIVDPLLANQTYTVYAAVTYNDSRVLPAARAARALPVLPLRPARPALRARPARRRKSPRRKFPLPRAAPAAVLLRRTGRRAALPAPAARAAAPPLPAATPRRALRVHRVRQALRAAAGLRRARAAPAARQARAAALLRPTPLRPRMRRKHPAAGLPVPRARRVRRAHQIPALRAGKRTALPAMPPAMCWTVCGGSWTDPLRNPPPPACIG